MNIAKQTLKKKNRRSDAQKPRSKADLDKDGKLSGYEKKRGMAIEKAMGAKRGRFAEKRKNLAQNLSLVNTIK